MITNVHQSERQRFSSSETSCRNGAGGLRIKHPSMQVQDTSMHACGEEGNERGNKLLEQDNERGNAMQCNTLLERGNAMQQTIRQCIHACGEEDNERGHIHAMQQLLDIRART